MDLKELQNLQSKTHNNQTHSCMWIFLGPLYSGQSKLIDSILVRVTVAVRKHQGQKQLWEGRLYLACPSPSLSIIKGSQNGNSGRAGT